MHSRTTGGTSATVSLVLGILLVALGTVLIPAALATASNSGILAQVDPTSSTTATATPTTSGPSRDPFGPSGSATSTATATNTATATSSSTTATRTSTTSSPQPANTGADSAIAAIIGVVAIVLGGTLLLTRRG